MALQPSAVRRFLQRIDGEARRGVRHDDEALCLAIAVEESAQLVARVLIMSLSPIGPFHQSMFTR
jgi:hypothetical protein